VARKDFGADMDFRFTNRNPKLSTTNIATNLK
jgi:hypothetical protein